MPIAWREIIASVFPLSMESQPWAFISIASDISNQISSPLRSATESKPFPFMPYSISRNTIIQREATGALPSPTSLFGGDALT